MCLLTHPEDVFKLLNLLHALLCGPSGSMSCKPVGVYWLTRPLLGQVLTAGASGQALPVVIRSLQRVETLECHLCAPRSLHANLSTHLG